MTQLNNEQTDKKESYAPLVLSLLMIAAGILIALFGETTNDLQRYSFVIVISLGAGLVATYLTGQITGGGKFGFLNIKSATGGFFVWLISLSCFLYFFPKSSAYAEKYFNLGSLSEFGMTAFFTDKNNSTLRLSKVELYSILDDIKTTRTSDGSTLSIKFKFSKWQLYKFKKFAFSFDESFSKKISPTLHIQDWQKESTGNMNFSYSPTDFKSDIEFKTKILN